MATKEKKPQVVRVPKGKTPAQIAKRDRNIRLAAQRLIELQAQQKAEIEARKNRLQVQVADAAEAKAIADAENARAQYEKDYVESALNGPAYFVLKRWLADRPATFFRVSKFFNTRHYLPQPLSAQSEPKAA